MATLDTSAIHLTSSSSGNTTDSTWKLGSPKAKIAQIEILVCVTTSLLVFLTIFGTRRRRSRSWFLKGTLWTAYNTSTFLIAYTLGLMQAAPFKSKLFPIWGMFLLISYAFPDSFSAYSLDDVEHWKQYYCEFTVKLGGLAFLWAWSFGFKVGSIIGCVIIYGFLFMVLQKFMKRWISLVWASRSFIEERAKLFEVYMKYEHQLSDGYDINPLTMTGYNYLVAVTGDKKFRLEDVLTLTPSDLRDLVKRDNVVTLEKVWSCEGRLLTSSRDPDNRLKDICLSFALLKILFLKWAGYTLPMEAKDKASRFVREGLLSDHNRAFRVIEVELKLLYELAFTKYPLYASACFAVLRVIEFLLAVFIYSLLAVYIAEHADSLRSFRLAEIRGLNLDIVVTYILLGMIVLADIVQLVMIASSEWVKASFIFNYVAKKSWQNNGSVEKLVQMICKPQVTKPWTRMLGQYSLIGSQGYNIGKPILGGQKEGKAVHLSDEVKHAVLECLRTDGNNLENGRSSLRRNGVYEELPGLCEGEHEAEVILVWHVATGYCQHSCQHRSSVSKSSDKNCMVATDLSNYLAYLVAFAPRLLPGPPLEPVFHFRRVMKEAREAFKGCKKVEDRIRKLDKFAEEQDEAVILRGARLGKQLLQLREDIVWKILAEFWSEMALCVATSGDVREHVEKLANGGEFITHLWALLHHAGISSPEPAAAL